MTAATVTTSTTTHSDRANAPRHRATPDPVRATKAAVRAYRRTIAARRRNRDSLTIVSADTQETQR